MLKDDWVSGRQPGDSRFGVDFIEQFASGEIKLPITGRKKSPA